MIWPEDKLTRFEIARLIGARSLQIALGAPILTKSQGSSSLEIAKREFKEMLIPMTVKRKLPNGQHSVVKIKKAIENWISGHEGEL